VNRLRGLLGAAAVAAAAAVPAPSAPGDPEADAAFVRGQRLEESLGDLEGAAASFRAAAATGSPERRSAALLRAAAVLRRLGCPDDARAALQSLLEDEAAVSVPGAREAAEREKALLGGPAPPPESPEMAGLRDRARSLEEALQRTRLALSRALTTTAEVEPLRESVHRLEGELKDLRARLEDAGRSARGGAGEPTEEEIAERRRREAGDRRLLSLEWLRYGREFYRAGRFDDARKFLRDAVDLDPDNVAARDLLARASAPSGGREQMVRGILEFQALEQRIRGEELAAEASALVDEARRFLDAGETAAALDKCDAALQRIAAHPDLLDRIEPLRAQAAAIFDEAARKSGSPRRAPAAPPAAFEEDPRWQEAIRSVLERAGSAGEAGGAAMRIFPLAPILRAQREALPPSPEAGTRPRGFVLSGDVPPAGPLLQAAFRGAVEPAAWRAPGAVLEGVGATLVARAGARTLEETAKAVAGLAAPPARSVLVRATAFTCAPAALVAALAKEGCTLAPLPGGTGAAAALDPGAAEAVLRALGGAETAAADALFRVPERRGFALAALRPREGGGAEEEAAGLRLSGIGWFLPDGGIAAGLVVATAVPGAPGAAEALGAAGLSRQEASMGAALLPGGGILVAGLSDPLAPAAGGRGHLAVLLRFGEGAALGGGGEGGARDSVLPLGDLPGRHPDAGGPLSGGAEADPRRDRAEAIRRWLARRAGPGAAVTLEGNGVRVAGPAAAAGLAATDLERLRGATGAPALEVRAYALDARTEAALVRDLRLETGGEDSLFRFALLAGEDRRRRLFLLEGGGARLALGAGEAGDLAPARRVPFARTEGTGARMAALEAGVRAWPGERPGEPALWVDLAVKSSRDAEPRRDPPAAVPLPPGTAVLFVGLPNPFEGAAARPRLAVWIEGMGD